MKQATQIDEEDRGQVPDDKIDDAHHGEVDRVLAPEGVHEVRVDSVGRGERARKGKHVEERKERQSDQHVEKTIVQERGPGPFAPVVRHAVFDGQIFVQPETVTQFVRLRGHEEGGKYTLEHGRAVQDEMILVEQF